MSTPRAISRPTRWSCKAAPTCSISTGGRSAHVRLCRHAAGWRIHERDGRNDDPDPFLGRNHRFGDCLLSRRDAHRDPGGRGGCRGVAAGRRGADGRWGSSTCALGRAQRDRARLRRSRQAAARAHPRQRATCSFRRRSPRWPEAVEARPRGSFARARRRGRSAPPFVRGHPATRPAAAQRWAAMKANMRGATSVRNLRPLNRP